MRLITPTINLTLNDLIRIKAGQRVVMACAAASALHKYLHKHAPQVALRVSGLVHYSHPYQGQDLNGKRLLAWRGAGWGDQFVWAGLLRILKTRYPRAEIALLCNPKIYPFWKEAEAELPFSVYYEPCSFEDWKSYDYHLVGEGLVEDDQEPDQPNIWDGHLRLAGIAPASVAPELKRPLVPILPAWRNAAAAWLQKTVGRDSDHDHAVGKRTGSESRPTIVWQLSASTPIRSYPPDQTRRALALLAKRLPEADILVASTPRELAAYRIRPTPAAPYHLCVDVPFQTVLALVERADLIICPDSAIGHAAAAFGRPCVSLWSSFHPDDRVRYYPTHRPIYRAVNCGPCHVHESSPQAKGCPLATSRHARHCRGLAAIPPGKIVAAALAALSPTPARKPPKRNRKES